MPLFTRFYTSHVIPCGCLGCLNHQHYLVLNFPASPTLIVASQAQVARSSVQQITTLWLYITLCQSNGKKTIHIGKYRKYRYDVDSVDWFFNSSWQYWILWPVSSWEQLRPPDRNLEDHEGGWQRHYNLNVSSNIYHGKGMAVSCHHEKLASSQRVVSSASKLHYPRRLLESSWKISSLFRSAKTKHVLTKTMAYRKKTMSSKFMVLHFAVANVTTGGSNAQIQ